MDILWISSTYFWPGMVWLRAASRLGLGRSVFAPAYKRGSSLGYDGYGISSISHLSSPYEAPGPYIYKTKQQGLTP